jgi:hypothetical protein
MFAMRAAEVSCKSARLGGVAAKHGKVLHKLLQSPGEGQSAKLWLFTVFCKSWAACGYFDLSLLTIELIPGPERFFSSF